MYAIVGSNLNTDFAKTGGNVNILKSFIDADLRPLLTMR